MKIFGTLFICLIFMSNTMLAQKTISGKSQPLKFTVSKDFKRGLPPNLFLSMSFEDDNNNGLLEALESANLRLTIENKGKGTAQGLLVKVKDNIDDQGLIVGDLIEIPFLFSGKTITVNIPIHTTHEVSTNEHKLEIVVTEHFGYDIDPAYLILNTLKYQEPNLFFAGLDIVDKGEGLMAIEEDGQVQAGEMVNVKLIVQNIGQNISHNTKYKVETSDKNIFIVNDYGEIGNIDIGEVKEFWITITPNKRVTTKGSLPLFLTLKNEYGIGEIHNHKLPIELNQKPPKTEILSIKPNVENLVKQVARFEYNSNKIKANVGNLIDIKQVLPSKTKRPNSVAILIGIEEYNYFAPAPYATNDAKIVEEYFKNVLGVLKIFSYTNEEVNGFFFENTFNPDFGELQKAIIKGKTELFIFYSGHGMPSKSGKNIYLFPHDGRIEALESQGYDINKFYAQLNELGARETTVFMDACFSGMSRSSETIKTKNLISMKGVRIVPEITQPWEGNPAFSVFSSSDFNETSLGFDQSDTGLFTYFLCAGLQGNADNNKDNIITSGELADYISKNVISTSKKLVGLQSPQFYGNKDQKLVEY